MLINPGSPAKGGQAAGVYPPRAGEDDRLKYFARNDKLYMELKREQIEHIAKLARLELTEEELEKYGSQLSDILNYIDQLREVDVAGVEPTAQVTGLENVLRIDEIKDWDGEEVDLALKDAPELEGRQIKVKRVIE